MAKRGTRRYTFPGQIQPQPIDIGPKLWQAFGERLASAPLTALQRRFVVEYLRLLCGAKAARAAGYSPNRDRQQAYDNLPKPKIKRLVQRAQYLRRRDWQVEMGFMSPDAKQIPRD